MHFGHEQDYTIHSHLVTVILISRSMAHCNAAIVVHFTHPVGKNAKHFFVFTQNTQDYTRRPKCYSSTSVEKTDFLKINTVK